jgi:DNA-binding CsgD family transcriptional regulator
MSAQQAVQENHILTPREKEVLAMVGAGLRAKDIASALGISERTIETHMSEVRFRLRAKTAAHAVSIGIGMGIIQPEKRGLGSQHAGEGSEKQPVDHRRK